MSDSTIARPRSRVSLREYLVSGAAGRLFAAYWGSLVVVDLTRGLPDGTSLLALAALAAVCSIGQGVVVAVAVSGTAWLFLTGFVVNAYGVLDLSGPGDLVRLSALTLTAVVAALATRPGPTR